jgi:hypothetical protein
MIKILRENMLFFALSAIALALVFYFTYRSRISGVSFDIDEADYMYSLEKGFSAHYFDRNTLSIRTFIETGFSKGMKRDKDTELSKMIRSADDITLFRHFHGPLYFYYMILAEKFVGKSERAVRTASLFLLYISSIVMLSGCLMVLGGRRGRIPSFLTALLALLSPSLFFTASMVSPHAMYVVWCSLSLFCMVQAVATGKKMWLYISAFVVAVTFLTTEYVVVLLICWVVSVIAVYRKDRSAFRSRGRFILNSLIIYAGVITVLWPAAFFKMSLLKSNLVIAYTFFLRGIIRSSQPLLEFWWNRIAASPVEYGIIAMGVIVTVYCVVVKKKISLLPLLLYLVLIMLMEVRHLAPVPTYVSSIVIAGFAAAGITLTVIFEKKTWVPICLLSFLCIASFIQLRFYYLPCQLSPRLLLRTEITTFLKKEMPEKVLVARPMLSLIHYYFRGMTADSYIYESASKEQQITDIKASLTMHADYNGIIYTGKSVREVEAVIAEHYACEPVVFTRPDWDEEWVYFRLRQKMESPGNSGAIRTSALR